ncbi:hypothetical protein TNCV_396271 [Trichonephila clavipes]|nr:hypothetical protein TNCV_396271 [Trichonephila clavipes]
MASRLRNKFQTSGAVTGKVGQGPDKEIEPTQDHYLSLSKWQHRRTVYRRLAETDIYVQRPVLCVPLAASKRKKLIIEKPKASVVDTTILGVCSFQ